MEKECSGKCKDYLSFLPNLPLTPADILTGSFIVKIKKEIAPKLNKMPENLRKQVIEEFLSKEEFLKHIDVVVGIFLNSSPGIKRCMLTNVLSKDTKKADEQIKLAGINAKKLKKLTKLPKKVLLKWVENVVL